MLTPEEVQLVKRCIHNVCILDRTGYLCPGHHGRH